MSKNLSEKIQTNEEYPLEIKPIMEKAEERMTRKVQNTFSKWNYDVFQWAVGITQDVKKQNEEIRKDTDKLVITERDLSKELKSIIKVEDFLVENDILTSSMIVAVGYSFDELAIEIGSKSMANAILVAMNLSFNIQYDMPLYNRILAERKEWLAEKLYDTTVERVPEIISRGIKKGLTIDEITELLQDVIGIDKDRATKIARTETNYSINEAIRQQTHELGITKYRISTAVNACDLCQMDSNIEYTYEQASDLLPIHPNCRCVLQSVIPSSWLRIEKSLKENGLEKTISKGYIPIKGMDYFTSDEVEEFKKSVTPIKGKDYLTEKEVLEVREKISPKYKVDYLVESEIKEIKKSITPIKGKDYFDGKDGKKGERGEKGSPGIDGSPDSPEDVKKKLESLSGNKRLDAKAIKNLDKYMKKEVPSIIMTGIGGLDVGKVKVDNTDNADYLENKIDAGTGVSLSKTGGKIKISSTGDQDLSGYALKSNVLELNNTIAFTPDADYEPATKKYVDDKITGEVTASDVSFTSGGDIVSTNVQDAIIEVDNEKASKNYVIAMSIALG